MPDGTEQTEAVGKSEIEGEVHCAEAWAAKDSVKVDVKQRAGTLGPERVAMVEPRGTRVNTHARRVVEPLIHLSLNRDTVSNMRVEMVPIHVTDQNRELR